MHIPVKPCGEWIALLCSAVLAVALSGCDSPTSPASLSVPDQARFGGADELSSDPEPPATPSEITPDSIAANQTSAKQRARERSVREAAKQVGSQHGFRRRAWEIQKRLETRASELSAIYDFGRVAAAAPQRVGFLLPPVVSRSLHASETAADGGTASAADEYLEILKPSVLSQTLPTWRDYLLFGAGEPLPLPPSKMPRSTAEQKQFERWVRSGWEAGAAQANAEFSHRLRRLRRDYEGMLEFRRLHSLGMAVAPETVGAAFGVTGHPGAMRIGDRTARITEIADFERDRQKWVPTARAATRSRSD